MALIVEDGTGLATAESYVSVADADAYHTKMGATGWTGSDAVKEAALRKATQYIDTEYLFIGEQVNYPTQRLEWPRYVDKDWPIRNVVEACCELALRALSSDLRSDTEDRSVKSEQVGPIAVTYSDSQQAGQVRYPTVDKLLRPYTRGGAGTVSVDRG